MTAYKFETDQFGLTDIGIHLLRSRFNYETIELASVDNIAISKGRQVNNWFILSIFGLSLTFLGLYTGIKVIYEYFFASNYSHFYVEQFVLPVLPLFAGIFSIYFSLKIGPVLIVSVKNKTKRFPIAQLKDKRQLDELIFFLENNNLTKSKFNVSLKIVNSARRTP